MTEVESENVGEYRMQWSSKKNSVPANVVWRDNPNKAQAESKCRIANSFSELKTRSASCPKIGDMKILHAGIKAKRIPNCTPLNPSPLGA